MCRCEEAIYCVAVSATLLCNITLMCLSVHIHACSTERHMRVMYTGRGSLHTAGVDVCAGSPCLCNITLMCLSVLQVWMCVQAPPACVTLPSCVSLCCRRGCVCRLPLPVYITLMCLSVLQAWMCVQAPPVNSSALTTLDGSSAPATLGFALIGSVIAVTSSHTAWVSPRSCHLWDIQTLLSSLSLARLIRSVSVSLLFLHLVIGTIGSVCLALSSRQHFLSAFFPKDARISHKLPSTVGGTTCWFSVPLYFYFLIPQLWDY